MMQMGAQPPARTVYQRALKPSPCVYFVVPSLPPFAYSESSQYRHLRLLRQTLDRPEAGVLVEADIIDVQGNKLTKSLDGLTTVRLQKSGWHDGVYVATFKKLKLLTTSQQRSGSKFCLRFHLKCPSIDLGPLGEMSVVSNPIEVFSHTQYLVGSQPSAQASATGAITRKYAHNPVGLQLKVMEMIHACKELGGSEEVLHQCISSVFGARPDVLPAFLGVQSSSELSTSATEASTTTGHHSGLAGISSSSLSGTLGASYDTDAMPALSRVSPPPSPLVTRPEAVPLRHANSNHHHHHHHNTSLHSSSDDDLLATVLPPIEPLGLGLGLGLGKSLPRTLLAPASGPATASDPRWETLFSAPPLPSHSAFHAVTQHAALPQILPSLPSLFPSHLFSSSPPPPLPLPLSHSYPIMPTPVKPSSSATGKHGRSPRNSNESSSSSSSSSRDVSPASLRGLLSLLCEKVNDGNGNLPPSPPPHQRLKREGDNSSDGAKDRQSVAPSAKRRRSNGSRARSREQRPQH